MTPILEITDTTCTVNEQAYQTFFNSAKDMIHDSMVKTPFKHLPVDHELLSSELAEKLFNKDRIKALCPVFRNEQQGYALLDKRFKNAMSGKLNMKNAYAEGFYKTSVKPDFKCNGNWEAGLYYYNGNYSCEDIIDMSEGNDMPANLYVIDAPHKSVGNVIIKNLKKLNKGHEIPVEIDGETVKAPVIGKGPKGENTIYNFPATNFWWDTRFIYGFAYLYGQNYTTGYWFQVPWMTAGNTKLEESKFAYNFGARCAIRLPIELNGVVKEKTAVATYIAANVDSGTVRGEFVKTAPGQFHAASAAVMYFFKKMSAKKQAVIKQTSN